MPMLPGPRKRSRGNAEQGLDGAPLKGWDFIQEKILSHDEDMIADYANDIDTLLVFAGLFSAVLTAFLVISLVLLQPDNTETTVQLLSLIALQNGAPAHMQTFLNDTAESLPTSTTFRAPTDAVTINTLWFTSLVLSLAAALFGILAKQWCREYLRWHSVIASARENVLIRQVRFEAWERWQVAAFVASIPAFLEIALVLFLVGLLIFVPTFSEHSLNIVVFVVIGSVLLGVVVLTLLSVFYRLCPFQTPTGWAFVHIAGIVRRTPWQLTKWVSIIFDRSLYHADVGFIRMYVHGWRWALWLHAVDKLSHPEKLVNWRAYGLYSVQESEQCAFAPLDLKQACEDIDADVDQAAVDAVQTSVLFRALLWVRRGSNDISILAAIRESLSSIHVSVSTTLISRKHHFLLAIHAICPFDVSATCGMMRSFFYDKSENSLSFRTGMESAFNFFDSFGPFTDLRRRAAEDNESAVSAAWEGDPVSLEICHAFIHSDLLSLVDDWLSVRVAPGVEQRRAVADRIALLLCVLRNLPNRASYDAAWDAGSNLTLPWAETLEEVYRRLAPHIEAYVDGLVSMCVELCRLLGPVVLNRDGGEYHIIVNEKEIFRLDRESRFASDRPPNLVSTWATLTLEVYRYSKDFANGRYLFVTSVSRVFETMQRRIDGSEHVINSRIGETSAPLAEMLSCMVHALRWSLIYSLPDCGSYTSLPWIRELVQCYQAAQDSQWLRGRVDAMDAVPLTGDPALRPTFFLVLRLLQTCLDRGFLTGEEAAQDFDRLLAQLEHPVLPQLPADLAPVPALEVELLPGPPAAPQQISNDSQGSQPGDSDVEEVSAASDVSARGGAARSNEHANEDGVQSPS